MNLKLDIEYKIKNQDTRLNLYNNVFSQKNYQLYAARFFQIRSNDLRWVFVDYHTGTGKTSTSLLMTENKYTCYVIGNQISHNAFIDAINNLQYDKNLYNFITYQAFANISENTLEQYFQNTIIIIDEFQNLFSQQGLNSYGIQLQKLVQLMISKIKIICLSGTVLNTQWHEIFYIGNIFKGYNYWNIEDPETLKFNSSQKKECVDYLKGHFLSYHDIINKKLYPVVKYIQKTNNKEKVILEDELIDQKTFPLYMSYDKNNWSTSNLKGEDISNIVQTTYILPKYYNNPHQQVKNGTIITNQDDIVQYSPLSKSFIDTVQSLLKDKSCTKIVGYGERIQYQWGLLQWAQILDNMGFIKYGEVNKNSTLCSECLIQFSKHPPKSQAKHAFKPLTYIIYYANLTMSERYEYTKIFNNPNNLYGHQCKCILLSEIAETGLSLKAVSDFFLLDNIPGFSQYQQIVARAVRMNSHSLLPENMHFVRVYNLCSVTLSSINSGYTTNYQQWQDMFQQGQALNKILDEIRNSREKIDDELFKSSLFTYQNLQQIISFLKGQDFNKYLDKKELKQIILNPELLKTDFQVKSINDECIDYIYFNMFSQQYIRNQKTNFQNKFLIDELKPIKNIQKVQGQTVVDLVKYNKQISLPQIKMFLKDYSQQIIQQIKALLIGFDTIYTAWFIYEGFVYIKDDEKNFLENHQKFYNFIWDKTYHYVSQHQKKIVEDFNIQGVYYANKVFKINSKDEITRISVFNNLSTFNKLSFYITSDIPSYQYKNEDFYIFGGRDVYDVEHEQLYQTLSIKFQIRYNVLYFLTHDQFQEPIFDINDI